ncbi:Signal transduction histidine kinase HoxJ (hydrogenase regulation) [Paramagnetospirillum magnetotacticum MS-1]|uniref:histidine kinase n=1 Tax=Paramagnetospirillum magnetotacticum MS-1 TaxID=272627 RepID=A0A0C2YPV8_PARME|nr:ATP-binding protein [Paramagnetospirillum magnetotacticum]KIL97133.1 Signal transduction histidine kinase HoxJ (hydrogenase regulation) [Paramagnetospirillum magnetotacticum MS-1]
MSIRTKLLVPLLLLAACVLAALHFVAFDTLKRTLLTERINGEQRALGLLALAIAPDMQASDLAKIHETMVEAEGHHPWWRSLVLATPMGLRLYPLLPSESEPANLLRLSAQVSAAGRPLGELGVEVDLDTLVAPALAVVYRLELAVILILILGTLAVVTVQTRTVISPLRRLAEASELLSRGRYDVVLPLPSADEVGNLVRAFESMRNAVAHREAALTESEGRFRDLAESASDWFWETDTDYRLTFVSDRIGAILGVKPSAILGYTYFDVGLSDYDTDLARTHAEDLAAHRPFRDLLFHIGPADAKDEKIVRISGMPFYDENGLFIGYRGIGADVTREARAEERARQAQLELANQHAQLERLVEERTEALKQAQVETLQASRMASVGQLAAGIAHEINTPIQYIGDNLAFIKSAAETVVPLLGEARSLAKNIASGGDSADQGRAFLDRYDAAGLDFLIEETPQAVAQSLEGVAQVARIVLSMKEFSHPGTTQKSAVDINHALDTTLVVCRNTWKHVAGVETRFDSALPLVNCHPGEMNQVFLNLIVNAAHAIESSGKPRPGTISVETRLSGDWAEIRISDTGTGISDDIAPHIFDPFFTTKEVGKGTGQGLAICYDVVVNKHGGQILVGGTPGEGAVFTVRIPVA